MRNLQPIGEPFKTYEEYVYAFQHESHPLHKEARILARKRWGNTAFDSGTREYQMMHDRIVLSNNRD